MFGDDPTLCIYKNDMMRRHLYQCLVSGKLTPCRMPELKNVGMIECTSCSKWFHLVCGDVPTQVLNDQPHGIVIFVIARLLCIHPGDTYIDLTITVIH